MPHDVVRELLLILVVALGCVVVLGRLRVPSLVALVLAGLLAGPGGLRIVTSGAEIEIFAEAGVALLLFTVGLDFPITELRRVLWPSLLGGTLQMVATGALAAGVAHLVGAPLRLAIFCGAFVALSSTAVVLKTLGARNQIDAPHGRLTVGVLVLQDMAIVVLLLLVPILSGQTSAAVAPMAFLRGLLALAAVAVASRLILPVLMRVVVAAGRGEGFTLAIVLASLGTAWVATRLGLSGPMGAFLAGLVLAGSPYGHQAHAEARPLREILGGLFFVSLGMLVDVRVWQRQAGVVLLLALALVVGKAIVASLALLATGQSRRTAVASGLALAQVGEFSFVLGKAGLAQGLLPSSLWQAFLASSILTMALTPLLIAAGDRLGVWLGRRRPKGGDWAVLPETLEDHVVVLGFGLGGQLVARALRESGVRYVILELNGETVRRCRAAGEPILYGDATQTETLRALRVERARAVVGVLNDPLAAERIVRGVVALAPDVPVIVRTRYWLEARRLMGLGARVAVAEEIETSLEVTAHLLGSLGVARPWAEALLERLRADAPGRRTLLAPPMALAGVPGAIGETPVLALSLGADEWAVGRTVAEVDLRARTGVLIVAVESGGERLAPPPAQRRLAAGDVLYLMGDAVAVAAARRRLKAG
jgi:CPA2 family monovalent cation:H+ antiporter-2